MRFTGKIAVVTGAASGIGRATCRRFAAAGARVACIDSDAAGLEQVCAELAATGASVSCIPADVSSSADVNAAIERVTREWNGVHLLVNVAGRNFEGDVAALDEQAWDACLAVNLKSVFLTSKAVWPWMIAQGEGVILNTSSVMGRVGAANAVAYAAAKAAIINLTRCLAVDGAAHGIRANVVCPGVVDTPVMSAVFGKQADPEAAQRRMTQQLPLNRMADPDEVAAAFVYLASDDARYVTGTELVIDGGLSSLLALRG